MRGEPPPKPTGGLQRIPNGDGEKDPSELWHWSGTRLETGSLVPGGVRGELKEAPQHHSEDHSLTWLGAAVEESSDLALLGREAAPRAELLPGVAAAADATGEGSTLPMPLPLPCSGNPEDVALCVADGINAGGLASQPAGRRQLRPNAVPWQLAERGLAPYDMRQALAARERLALWSGVREPPAVPGPAKQANPL